MKTTRAFKQENRFPHLIALAALLAGNVFAAPANTGVPTPVEGKVTLSGIVESAEDGSLTFGQGHFKLGVAKDVIWAQNNNGQPLPLDTWETLKGRAATVVLSDTHPGQAERVVIHSRTVEKTEETEPFMNWIQLSGELDGLTDIPKALSVYGLNVHLVSNVKCAVRVDGKTQRGCEYLPAQGRVSLMLEPEGTSFAVNEVMVF